MNYPRTRGVLLACSIAMVLLGTVSEASACACLDRLCPWNWGRGSMAATTYAPPYVPPVVQAAPSYSMAVPAAAPVAAPVARTCAYVPQTCYRTVYETVPMTTCRAVNYCDPCSGCPMTCYRPVTSYVRRARLVPYTTYRMVWSDVCAPASAAYSPLGTIGSGCVSCGVGTTITPAPTYVPSTTVPSTTVPSTPGTLTPVPSTTSPPSSSPPSSSAPKTFGGQDSGSQLQKRMKPIPDKEIDSTPSNEKSSSQPKLIEPAGRTTARPIRQAALLRPLARPIQPARLPLNDGGWRASR